jgi:hypothetical protein
MIIQFGTSINYVKVVESNIYIYNTGLIDWHIRGLDRMWNVVVIIIIMSWGDA